MEVKHPRGHQTSASWRVRARTLLDHAHQQVQAAVVPLSLMTPVPSVWAA